MFGVKGNGEWGTGNGKTSLDREGIRPEFFS